MIKFFIICEKCGNHDGEEATIEFNFRDRMVYSVCPKCKHLNQLKLDPATVPLPRIGRMR